MKFSLRNLALAGVMTLAGVAMAQDAPFTVTKNWHYTGTAADISSGTKNDARFGAGVNGAVYFNEKAAGVIKKIDANGISNYASVTGLGTAIGADDAGNLLVNTGFPNASSGGNWVLVKADGTQVPVTVTAPEGISIGRLDQQGRIVGDMTSEDGAFAFLCQNGAPELQLLYIKECAQADLLDYMTTDGSGLTINTSAVANPLYSFEEMMDMGDDAVTAFAFRNRSSKVINVSGDNLPAPAGTNTTEGFDVFMLGDKLYQVLPTGNGNANYDAKLVIADEEGNIVWTSDLACTGNNSQSFGTVNARKIDENTVELYQYYVSGASIISAGMWTISDKAEEPELPVLYITGNCTNPTWSADSPEEMTYADGKFTYNFTSAAQFKISTKKGSWDDFNAGVIGIADDNTTLDMELDKVYTLDASKLGNFGIAKNGTYTLTVDLEAKTAVLTGEEEKPVVPETLYLMGNCTGWDWNNAITLVKDEEDNFFRAEAVDFPAADAQEVSFFGVFSKFNDWSEGRFGPKENGQLVEDYDVVEMFPGMGDNSWTVAPGKYDVFVNWDRMTIALSPYEEPAPTFVVKYWTNFGEEMEPEGQIMMETEGSEGSEYFIAQDFMAGMFYFDITMGMRNMLIGCEVAEGQEEVAYGEGIEIELDKDMAAAYEGGFFKVPGKGITDAMIKLKFTPEGELAVNVTGTLVPNDDPIEEPVFADKAHFVYNVKHEGHVDGIYTIKFHSTGDAAKAVLVLNEVDGEGEVEAELGKVVKGENTFTYDANDLTKDKNYTWSVRLHGYEVPEVKISDPIAYTEGAGRAGIVVFTDPAYPEVFGKVVLCPASARNLYVYAADGTLEKTVDVTKSPFNQSGNANNSSPMDGKQRGNEAVFASWGDTSNGVVAYNVVTDEIYGVFEGTKNAAGAITNAAGEYVGSGTPCLAFQGKGEDTKLFTFDEDCFGNNLAMNPIGAAKTTSKAAENWGLKSLLANTNVGLWPAENGLFLTQMRGDGMDVTTALSYLDIEEQDVVWSIRDAAAANGYDPDDKDLASENSGLHFCPSASAGVCVNPAGDLLALSTYDGVEVYLLGWEENAMGTLLPTLEKYATVKYPGGRSSVRTNVQFDAANNLYVQQQGTKSFYTVTLAEKEPIALTAAHEQYTIANPTVVANIAVDAANGDAVYYNINGVRVNGKLAAGVYVKVVDGKATKVVVK